MLQRQQGSYILTVEAGRQLLLSADSCAEVDLQAELSNIQEQWKHACSHLEEQKKALTTLLKVKIFCSLRSVRTVLIQQISPTVGAIICMLYRIGRDAKRVLVDHLKNSEPSSVNSHSLFLITRRIFKMSRCAAR